MKRDFFFPSGLVTKETDGSVRVRFWARQTDTLQLGVAARHYGKDAELELVVNGKGGEPTDFPDLPAGITEAYLGAAVTVIFKGGCKAVLFPREGGSGLHVSVPDGTVDVTNEKGLPFLVAETTAASLFTFGAVLTEGDPQPHPPPQPGGGN